MRTEYFLLCKKTFKNDGFLNKFKKPIFVKGTRYKIIKDVITFIMVGSSGISGISGTSGINGTSGTNMTIIFNPPYSGSTSMTTTSTTTCVTTTTSTTNSSWTSYNIEGKPVSEDFISNHFYSIKEERRMKLKKLNSL